MSKIVTHVVRTVVLLAGATVIAAGIAASARADTLTLNNLGWVEGSPDIVTLTYTGPLPPAGTYDNPNGEEVYAGEMTLTDQHGTTYNVFCTDIFNDFFQPGTFTPTVISNPSQFANGNSNAPMTSSQLTQLTELLNGVTANNYITDSVTSAAVQVAVWAVENKDTNSVSTGPFQTTDDSAGGQIVTDANALLSDIGTTGWNNANGTLTEFVSSPSGNQDFTMLTVDPVPEPGSMLLLGTALVGMGAFSRRRRTVRKP